MMETEKAAQTYAALAAVRTPTSRDPPAPPSTAKKAKKRTFATIVSGKAGDGKADAGTV